MQIYRNLGNLPNVALQVQGQVIPNNMLSGTHDVAVMDINGDGWLDYYANRLFVARPKLMDPNDEHHWVKFKLTGVESNRAAIGAQIRAQLPESVIIRQIEGGKGTGCQQGFIQHMGLGLEDQLELVEVRWPNGLIEWFGPVQIDRVHQISEGDGGTQEEPAPLGDFESTVPGDDVTDADVLADTNQSGDVTARADEGSGPEQPQGGGCAGAPAQSGSDALIALAACLLFLLRSRRRSRDLVDHPVQVG